MYNLDDDRRRLAKFLKRAELALVDSPIIALRDPQQGEIGMTLTTRVHRATKTVLSSDLTQPSLDRRTIDSCIVDCRVFFHVKESCYLPSVMNSLRNLVTRERARAMKPLSQQVGQVVKDGALVGARMYSGRLEMDNGLGPGKLLGSDQIAMDYINGVAFHEDDARVARLANTSGAETIAFAVILQLDQLLMVVENVQAQILHDIDKGYIDLTT